MSLQVKPQYEFEAYISTGGYLCIKQKDLDLGKETCLMLTPDQYKVLDSFVSANFKEFRDNWNQGILLEDVE